VKPLLYVYRVLLTGIHLMRSGQIEANLLHSTRVPAALYSGFSGAKARRPESQDCRTQTLPSTKPSTSGWCGNWRRAARKHAARSAYRTTCVG